MKKLIQLTITTILLTTTIAQAQTPDLGTAASFAFFTNAGAITNTGISQITGNIGLRTGAISGFGNVNGNLHSGGLTANAASASLLTAYTYLDNAIPTDTLAPLLGNDDTLAAGTYVVAGNTTLSDTLYLDGLSDASSVFIFKINGPLSSLSAANIVLLNGAQACNVFWKVEGMINLATLTQMKGTLIANNAAIDLANGVTLQGRALSTAGAITLNGSLVYTPIGCGSPYLTGPAAPLLGAAACFVLFTSNGPATNNGITTAIGDIGTNVGLTTGYDPLLVTGTVHPIPDGATNNCAADLLVAYGNLNLLPHDIELLYPAQFGNSLVLTPHTYLLNAATALTDTVFLNAQGNADAVFVFKINGALSTSTFAHVALVNGTQAKNVFWKVEGAVNLSSFAQMKGNIIANNGAIDIGTGVQLVGRALSTNGALSTQAISAIAPDACGAPLGLDWLSFTGTYKNAQNILNWQVAGEQAAYFEVERSLSGKDFKPLYRLLVDLENDRSQFTYTDLAPLPSAYYRIARIDHKGKLTYSAILKMTHAVGQIQTSATVAPNPLQHSMNITLTNALAEQGHTVMLYNMQGKKVLEALLSGQTTHIDIDMPNGIYLYRILLNNEILQSGKVIISL